MEIDIEVEVDVDIDGCFGVSKSVQVLVSGIEAVMVLTWIILE